MKINSILPPNSHFLSFFTGNIGTVVLRFFYFVSLTKIISLTELGLYTSLLSITAILLNIVSLGSYNYLMQITKDSAFSFLYIRKLFLNSFKILVFISALIYTGSFFYIFPFSVLFLIKLFWAEFLFTVFPSLLKSASLISFDSNLKKDALTNLICSLLLLLVTLVVMFFWDELTLDIWISIYLSVSVFIFVVRVFIWRKELNSPFPPSSSLSVIAQVSESWPFIVSSLLRVLAINIDKLLIVSYFGLKVAGYYAIAFRFYNFFLLGLNTIAGYKEGVLYSLAADSKVKFKKELDNINFKTFKYAILAGPVYIVICVFIYHFYESTSSFILTALFIILPLQLLANSYLNALNSLSKTKLRTLLLCISISLNFALTWILKGLGWGSVLIGLFSSLLFVVIFSFFYINKAVKNG